MDLFLTCFGNSAYRNVRQAAPVLYNLVSVPHGKLQVPAYTPCMASVDESLPVRDCMWGIGEHGGLVLFLFYLFPKQLSQ